MNNDSNKTTSVIALCTDTHFWHNTPHHKTPNYVAVDGRTQLQGASAQIQQTLLDDVRQHNPDLVIHLGDWSCGGGSFNMPVEEFCATQQEMNAAFCALPCPVHALPGNHDCPQGSDYGYFAQLWGQQTGIGCTIDLPVARLVLVNTHGHAPDQLADAYPNDPISGWVSEAERQRLEAALASAGNRPVILFLHQLLMPWVGDQPWQDLYGIDNGEEVLRLMKQYANVRAVFQGHAHMLNVQPQTVGGNPCTFVVSPAVIEYPMAWLLLKLSDETLNVQVQRLSLPDLAQVSRGSGQGQAWRAGQREWQQFNVALK